MPKRARPRKPEGKEKPRPGRAEPARRPGPDEVARPPERDALLNAAALALPALFCLGIYIYTLAPSVVGGDSPEFVGAIHVLGVPHPTGYPLYMLLGKAFELLVPVGGIAYRINLFSAVCGAAMVALLSLLVLRVTGSRLAAMVAGIVGGLNGSAWSQAVMAEVYTLHGVLVMVVLLALFNWERQRTWRAVAWLALATGFGLAHHRAILFIATPALIAAVALQRPLSLKGFAKAVAAGAAPLALYIYIPVRAAAKPLLNWGDATTWSKFWYQVMAKAYMGLLLERTLRDTLHRAWLLMLAAASGISWPGLIAAFAGAVVLVRKRPVLGTVTAVSFVTHLLWFSAYHDVVVIQFHLPTFLIIGLWLAVAVHAAQQWVTKRTESAALQQLSAQVLPGALLLALVALLILVNFDDASERNQWEVENWPRRPLAQMRPNALLAGVGDTEMFATWYMQAVHGLRRDITVLRPNRCADPWYLPTVKDREIRYVMDAALLLEATSPRRREPSIAKQVIYMLAKAFAGKKPLYTFHPPAVLPPGVYTLEHAMGLREFFRGKPHLLSPTSRVAGPQLFPGLMLVRADFDRLRVRQGEPLRITFGWRCKRAIRAGFTIAVRFVRVMPRREALLPGARPTQNPWFVQVLPLNYGQPLEPTPAGFEYRQAGFFVAEYPHAPGRYTVIVGIGKVTPSGRWTLVPRVRAAVGQIEILPARKGAL